MWSRKQHLKSGNFDKFLNVWKFAKIKLKLKFQDLIVTRKGGLIVSN